MRHHSLNQGLGFSLFTIRGDKISPLSNSASDDAKKLPEIISIRSSTSKSVTANIVTFAAALAVLPTVAKARQGAFEMDVEYYLKTVASRAQGKPDATIDAKTAKPAFASARVIDKDIATSTSEIILEEISRVSKVPVSDVSKKVNVQLQLYLPYFKGFVPIRSEALSDQYYFDITLYASYIVAAQLIPKSTDRVILRKNVGDSILDLLIKKKLIRGSATGEFCSLSSNSYNFICAILMASILIISSTSCFRTLLCDKRCFSKLL